MHWRSVILAIFLTISSQILSAKDSLNLDILKALDSVQNKNFNGAIDAYEKIYKQTAQKEYLKEAIKISFESKSPKFEYLLSKGDKILKDDAEFLRIKAMYLLGKNQIDKAKELLLKLIKTDNSDKNFLMLGMIAEFSSDKKDALLNYKKAYEINPIDDYIFKMSKFENEDNMYPLLKKHVDKNGCSLIANCILIAKIYISKNQYVDASKVFGELFEATGNDEYLNRGVSVLIYSKDSNATKQFLNSYEFEDDVKMDIYSAIGDNHSGYEMAQKIYKQSGDLTYLGMMAIFEYEKNLPNISKTTLNSVMQKFEKSAEATNKDIFLNYYGYLLIDYDIDYKKGIKLIDKALKIDPKSPYYLDSLAWGYFKIKDCQKARQVMDQALQDSEFSQSEEAKSHSSEIDRCLKLKR